MVAHLSELAAGPVLAAALAGRDRGQLQGDELVALLVARARQVAHEQAELLADTAAVLAEYSGPDESDVVAPEQLEPP